MWRSQRNSGYSVLIVSLVLWLQSAAIGLAQSNSSVSTSQPVAANQAPKPKPTERKNPDEFTPNPLELREPDPLLPNPANRRPLTESERQQLKAALDDLATQAEAKYQTVDRLGAYELWNREARLRRALGPLEEAKALGRFGNIAWGDSNTQQVRWITTRLDKLRQRSQAKTPPQPETVGKIIVDSTVDRTLLQEALGLAYQQVRLPRVAAEVYEQVLSDARQQQDEAKIDETLNTLGELHLSWFNFLAAADPYKELLARAQAKQDSTNQALYLTQLAYLYEESKQPAQAVIYQQQLVELYQALNTPIPIPGLQIKLADNYQKISRLDLAEKNYQQAYQLAQTLIQLGYASEALQKLGILYRTNNRLDAALRVYSFLIGLERQSHNYYGMLDAYDQVGKIQLVRKDYPQAITAYQQGLRIARRLKYREDYFTEQLQQASQQSQPPSAPGEGPRE